MKPESTDLRDQVPDLIPYLLPDERVVEVEDLSGEIAAPRQKFLPSAYGELLRLTGGQDLLTHAPIASLSTTQDQETSELRQFEVLFGRDALIAGGMLRNRYPGVIRASILRLAALQGVKTDQASEEEPGKIIHEARDPADPVAVRLTRRLGWGWPYYGSIDSTPLFILETCLLAISDPTFLDQPYLDREGEPQTLTRSLELALGWLNSSLAKSPLRLLEYQRQNPNGLINQFWEDSDDSLSHADGSLADTDRPIAALSVQLITYDALSAAAELWKSRGGEPKPWAEAADQIKAQLLDRFWLENEHGGFFAAGLDRDQTGAYRRLDTLTVNNGFALSSGLLDPADPGDARIAAELTATLFSPQLRAAAGIRTLASSERRFRPGGYHTGSVWLWTNEYIAAGLDRHGYPRLGAELRQNLWEIVQRYKKFPEFARGDDDSESHLNTRRIVVYSPSCPRPDHLNTVEQPPQDIQLWTVSAYVRASEALKKPVETAPEKSKFEDSLLRSRQSPSAG